MAYKIIDISKYNTITDWSKVKQSVDGIIIRVAFRGYGSGKISIDSKFEEFAKKCNEYGIPYGIYFMSSAISIAEAKEEAVYSVEMANRFNMTSYMPIFIDSEDVDGTSAVRRSDGLSKGDRTEVCKAFIKEVQTRGYKSGIYCSDSWTRDKLNWDSIKNLGINWIAKYAKNNSGNITVQASPCHMHQYTSDGSIPGIKGRCDVSNCYIELNDSAIVNKKETAAVPTIKNGSRGENAKLLQKNLNDVLGCSLVEDGIIGPKSIDQLKIFQKKHGLVQDGIYGKLSYAAMQKALKED